ncbi:ubiquitin carboxyl-terminal hydrolase 17 [Senna tora]|uniref:Ubiquitin carboxyl-terminal hydrolase 17 n=1 Tax=Senna tora TaxID=362788 RepID=A0A834ST51_9FABA|nr:ubiquitin carboxyl-terminal hydrolase 17 [Senna tora]
MKTFKLHVQTFQASTKACSKAKAKAKPCAFPRHSCTKPTSFTHSPHPPLFCLENPDAPTLSSPLPLPLPFPFQISLFAPPFPSPFSAAGHHCSPDFFPSAADAVVTESMYSKIGILCILCSGLILEVKKEEITRLVDMASEEEAAIAKMEASSECSFIPLSRGYQCAMCYSPTTMRCSKCKAVRYCSGKCQIIHWRHGHKDECCPPIIPVLDKEESNSMRVAVSQTQSDSHVRPSADSIGTPAGIASSNNSHSGFNPSLAERKSFDNDSRSRLAKAEASSHANEIVTTTSLPLDSKSYGNIEVEHSSASKKSNRNASQISDDTGFKSKLVKIKTDKSHDTAVNLVGRVHKRKVTTVEKSATDTFKCRSLPSKNCSSSEALTYDAKEESQLSKYKEVRKSSSTNEHLSSVNEGDVLPHTKSAKNDNYYTFPEKGGGIPNLHQNVHNSLKTSMRKVVQQFRSSRESSYNIMSVENEMGFPYELFMELYCYDKVDLYPFGLTNCGNSGLLLGSGAGIYLVFYVVHRFGQKNGWCFICEFEYLIQKAKEGNSPLSPIGILSKIHKIGSRLGHGREEDAHEFLRCAVDTMQSICLKEAGVSSPLAEETTLIGYTFGGYLRSKIKCLRCLGKSERYERMMDLTVEIDGDIGTLEDALGQFTAPEILEKDNKYNCSRCKSYEKARKKLTVLEAPNILTIVLKRFQSGNFEKLNKSVQFPEVLNMTPYMSGTKDKSPLYSLYAVVVHLDIVNAAYLGHYICYVKNVQGEWFRIDDSMVEPVKLPRVLSERAYMLLYARLSPKPPVSVSSTSNAISSAKFKRRHLEAVSASSKTKTNSNSMAASTFPPSSQQKHGKYPYPNGFDGPFSNEFVYPECRLHYGKISALVDSSSDLFSSSDASSCSTASTKDSASTADFTDYIFGEAAPHWNIHYGLSSDLATNEKFGTDLLVDSDPCRRLRAGLRIRR